jgi:hypothetical protein
VVWAVKQFQWPPDVVRRQTMRDLLMLSESMD